MGCVRTVFVCSPNGPGKKLFVSGGVDQRAVGQTGSEWDSRGHL